MKTYPKYDPEDIESLMLAKAFEELLPEEKVFVLKHLSSEAEYESMRMLLQESVRAFDSSRMDPPDALKHRVMNRYRAKYAPPQHSGFWMNLYLFFRNVVLKKPHFALAAASVLIFAGAYFWIIPQDSSEMAVQQELSSSGEKSQEKTAIDSRATTPEVVSEEQQTNSEFIEEDQAERESHTKAEQTEIQLEEEIPVAPPVSERSLNEEKNAGNTVQDAVQLDEMSIPSSTQYAAEVAAESPETPVSTPALVNDELIALLYTAR